MNELDLAISVVILVSALIGIFRGLVRETLSLASWVIAFGIAWTYSSPASAAFARYIDSVSWRVIAAFGSLFLATLVLTTIVSHFLHKVVKKAGLAGPDRALGFVFGMVRGGVIIAVLTLIAGATPLPQEAWWKQSLLIGYFQSFATALLDFLPPDMARQFGYS